MAEVEKPGQNVIPEPAVPVRLGLHLVEAP